MSDVAIPGRRRWPLRLAVALVAVAAALAVAFGLYVSDYHHAGDEARELVEAGAAGSSDVCIDDGSSCVAVGDPTCEYGLVLYPGAKVEAEAYVPLARKIARRGVFCVIARMPCNLAVLDKDAASALIAAYPCPSHWWVGGHSLGGAMAASYAASNADKVEGVAFLAAYPPRNVSLSGLDELLVYGSNEGVVSRERFDAFLATLDPAQVCEIEGGNHSQFGDYGTQPGDDDATISADEQRELAADAICDAILGTA